MIGLSLGSNVGDRTEHLRKAISLIVDLELITEDIRMSSVYSSKALLKEDAPTEWDCHFLNMVITGKKSVKSAHELLSSVQQIEQNIGKKKRGIWAPREIDIDILFYENQYINDQNLTTPHYHLLERNFIMIPLNEICPEICMSFLDIKFAGNNDLQLSEYMKQQNDDDDAKLEKLMPARDLYKLI